MTGLKEANGEFRQLVESGQYEAAAATLGRLESLDPESADAMLELLAWAHLAVASDRSHLERQLRQIVSTAPYLCYDAQPHESWAMTA